jgi:hypothetical protein
LRTASGARSLALLSIRAALAAGDPSAAARLAEAVSADSPLRREPDFQWMLASAYFLSRDYATAAEPLRALFESSRASDDQKAAAAYGLSGVYFKTGNFVEQIRYALSLRSLGKYAMDSDVKDLSVYWNSSGWDLNLLLDAEAPLDALQSFIEKYPAAKNVRLVQYSLAVRLTRENRYREAADLYESISAVRRGPRIRRLAALYDGAQQSGPGGRQARYELASFLADHPDGIYFNDALWTGLQNYALTAGSDARLTGAERERLIDGERKLRDDQEERWRAYQLLREVIDEADSPDLRRKAAALALQCVRRINPRRFGRQDEIRKADLELSALEAGR